MMYWARMAARLARSRLVCKDDLHSHEAAWNTLRRGPRAVLIARHRQNLCDTNFSVVSLISETDTVSSDPSGIVARRIVRC